MKYIIPFLCSLALVSACGGPQLTPEQKDARKAQQAHNKAAIKAAETVQVGGKSFQVAHVQADNFALVKLVSAPQTYFARNLEAAAQQTTGCKAAFDPGILAFLTGDIREVDLYPLSTKIRGKDDSWRVNLQC